MELVHKEKGQRAVGKKVVAKTQKQPKQKNPKFNLRRTKKMQRVLDVAENLVVVKKVKDKVKVVEED